MSDGKYIFSEKSSSEPMKSYKPSACERFSNYLVNDGIKILWISIWVICNLGLFAWKFHQYWLGDKKHVFAALSWGAPFARASAACISFNSALMLLTVLRNFLSWLRGTFLGDVIPVDKNLIFHRHIAWTIAMWTVMHCVAHMFNYALQESGPLEKLANLGATKHTPSYVNLFEKIPGVTGFVTVLVMVLMYSSAIRYVRSPMFNVFWYTHHLFVVYYVALSIHGTAALLEPATFYYWVAGPAFFYGLERTFRVLRGSQDTMLLLAIAHPSKVLELQMKKATFKYRPGQYLFLNCPSIAGQEWHPFTISSAPEEDFVSVHVRVVGDWTQDLWKFINPNNRLGIVQENLCSGPDGRPIFRIDGPFGAASEEVFTSNFKTVVLVAGGIGVTPFASILKSIRYKIFATGSTTISKVYFYWISRDKFSFEWFNEILAALEMENVNNFLEIHTYLTQQMRISEIRDVMYGMHDDGLDSITGLQTPTHFGRPDWNSIFSQIGSTHAGQDIGVFFCGPSVLSKQLYKMCRKFTSSKTSTRFLYHKENF